MKTSKIFLLFLVTCVYAGNIYAQHEIEVPRAPDLFSHELSKEEEEEYLKNVDDKLKQQLAEIKNQNKSKYNKLLRELYFKQLNFSFPGSSSTESRELAKKILEYEIYTTALAGKYKSANSAEKVKIKEDMSRHLSELFDLKEKERKLEVEKLEMKLQELKKAIDVRSKNKNEIVQRRMQELFGEGQYLDWE